MHRLRWAWRRARRGEGRHSILGPPGIGKTRLLAELAVSAARDGARISSTTFGEGVDLVDPADVDAGDAPTLVVLDDVDPSPDAIEDLERLSAAWLAYTLLAAAIDDSAPPEFGGLLDRRADDVVRPGPLLGIDDIREIAGLYIGDAAGALPASLLKSTGGVPRRIHRQVSDWALAETSRRLGAAASRAAAGRSDLRSVENELAGNVVDLQHREQARLYTEGQALDGAASPFFKGLAAFDVDDADLFFGRERLVAELVARLAGASLLGVVGPSGSGSPRRCAPG